MFRPTVTSPPTQSPATAAPSTADLDFRQHNARLQGWLRDMDFESMSADRILAWAEASFDPGRVVLSTSLQYTGVAMIHMIQQGGLDVRVATVDTLRLHPETYAFLREVEERFEIEIEVRRPDAAQVRSMVDRFTEYLFFDSKARQEYCCQVRKVRPHDELLKTADCWISGVRRDQSELRRQTPKATSVAEYGSHRRILQVNPLADWDEERVLTYCTEHDIPRHPLYNQGYRSIGCVICSTPSLPEENKRDGRWRWFNSDEKPDQLELKECGLHIPSYNI
ncbi:MAG: phosphoadenylyl-sulfate reductase [Candidatus Latescibacterota bacterium]|nr:phosphoadenylyl-sulfate reductase [Candidatus Latescibacterota bacterium]